MMVMGLLIQYEFHGLQGRRRHSKSAGMIFFSFLDCSLWHSSHLSAVVYFGIIIIIITIIMNHDWSCIISIWHWLCELCFSPQPYLQPYPSNFTIHHVIAHYFKGLWKRCWKVDSSICKLYWLCPSFGVNCRFQWWSSHTSGGPWPLVDAQ